MDYILSSFADTRECDSSRSYRRDVTLSGVRRVAENVDNLFNLYFKTSWIIFQSQCVLNVDLKRFKRPNYFLVTIE